ncbi:hypothetical protein PFDG_05065 [Plasmodium falciparum Dd2]|uniref:Uncharacterized protein n=1 Tax=Plasmodium falciparum (isolate Dd2) TaxID=57267 RepID=A0A0L7M9L5_PLAF4|nr:hypothetical protein PFDG_05065 [Plasmodium falciparum Dd2]
MVRSRYYVSSASHMISLLNLLIHAKKADNTLSQNIIDNDSFNSVSAVTGLHYLSHLVFRNIISSRTKDGLVKLMMGRKGSKAHHQIYERDFTKYFDDAKRINADKSLGATTGGVNAADTQNGTTKSTGNNSVTDTQNAPRNVQVLIV